MINRNLRYLFLTFLSRIECRKQIAIKYLTLLTKICKLFLHVSIYIRVRFILLQEHKKK